MIEVRKYGTLDQKEIEAVKISAEKISFTILTLGATVYRIDVQDRNGQWRDVILGYEDPVQYITTGSYFGATVGRNCNRIGGAAFELNGRKYQLTANDGKNQLHGGFCGLNSRIWDYRVDGDAVVFTTSLADGDDGYPGNMDAEVRYSIDGGNGLRMDYRAVCDQDTVANFTNHCYFNLNGAGSGTILKHSLWIDASHFTPVSADLIPTGEIRSVEGTCMDFRKPKPIGQDICDDFLKGNRGYDNNYCLNGSGMRTVAGAKGDQSGIVLTVETALEGIQLYTGNGVAPGVFKDGKTYENYGAFCLETQHYPDAVNHSNFPSPILKKGDTYAETTIYRFTAE